MSLTAALVVGLVAAGGIAYLVGLYNGLVEVRNNVDKAWKNIDVPKAYLEVPDDARKDVAVALA